MAPARNTTRSGPTTPTAPRPLTLADVGNLRADSDPRVVAATAKVNEMRSLRDETERELQAELGRLAAVRGGARRQAVAEAILDGLPEPPRGGPHRTADELRERKAALDDAVALAEQRLEAAVRDASRAICDRVRPYYAELTTVRVVAAARALLELAAEEARVADELGRGGTLRVDLERLVWPKATQEYMDRYLAFARMYGYLDPEPKEPARAATGDPRTGPRDPADWTA
jgi:hypothetical protein